MAIPGLIDPRRNSTYCVQVDHLGCSRICENSEVAVTQPEALRLRLQRIVTLTHARTEVLVTVSRVRCRRFPMESVRPLQLNRSQVNTGVWSTLPVGVDLTADSGR